MLLEGGVCRSELLGRKSFEEGQPIKHLRNKEKTNQPTKKIKTKAKTQTSKKELIELFLECFACQ